MRKNAINWFLLPIGLIVAIDEILKAVALERLPQEGSLLEPGIIAFAIHKNPGIAFDIPLKMPIIIAVSLAIAIVLLRVAWKEYERRPWIALSSIAIVLGGIGNMYDRLAYGFTVDYVILLGRSAINLSDLVILGGVLGLFLAGRRQRILTRRHG